MKNRARGFARANGGCPDYLLLYGLADFRRIDFAVSKISNVNRFECVTQTGRRLNACFR